MTIRPTSGAGQTKSSEKGLGGDEDLGFFHIYIVFKAMRLGRSPKSVE